MSTASLLNPLTDPSFDFDHDQMHRLMFISLPAGTQYSALPYQLDPVIGANVPAGWWNYNHAQAHGDFADAFPAITWPSNVDLVDLNLSEGSRAWWRLSNKQLHDIANTVLKPNR
jgi:hypothetical protein